MSCRLSVISPSPTGLLSLMVAVVLLTSAADAAAAAGTPRNFREIFLGRCEDYQIRFKDWFASPKNCSLLWERFHTAFAFRGPCDVNASDYEEFLQEARHDITGKPMYWSGAVYRLATEFAANARRFVTILDYLPAYITRNVGSWCGKREADGMGMDFDSCPDWGNCSGNGLVASEAYRHAVAADFASMVVQGDVYVILNGSYGQAYRRVGSTFGGIELPNLSATRNRKLHVYLIHDIEPRPNAARETCKNGTLVDLKNDVEAKNMEFACTDDPKNLLYLQCVDRVASDRCQFSKRSEVSGVGSQHQQLMLILALASSVFSFFIV